MLDFLKVHQQHTANFRSHHFENVFVISATGLAILVSNIIWATTNGMKLCSYQIST